MPTSASGKTGKEQKSLLREEVEKRYLAYALSTIVSRALPDVRDGLKPVHRRILYAMNSMGLSATAKMRKSAAVVGEVIGKYHPHGDQAAYDAAVRMAQDFSLRYPLIQGSGNFGSVDGDSPAAMRYTEARLSAFAGLLLREIDQGTTEFHPTYDGMGKEPGVLPSAVPNLLVNGSSGIAVGMSCSFPPHNLREVMAACRAAIKDETLDTQGLMQYIQGPDFPTGAEIIDQPDALTAVYASGYGSVRVRGTFELEAHKRGRQDIIITSIPYAVNKARLIERIAQLIKDKRLTLVHDIRDESTEDVRIVLEPKSGSVSPESVMAFLYKHTDLQVNYPMNFIAITPDGVPDRMGLDKIIRHFLDFRYNKTVLRLKHRLAILEKRIHVLEGFSLIFIDLDKALQIIRSARSRKEAADGLKEEFGLDDEQVDAILEMRLYKLVGLEMGKLLDELAEKQREAGKIIKDLSGKDRIWKIVDRELAEIADKFGDERRTALVEEQEAAAIEYNPDEFVEHEDTTVILSNQGWIRRMKMEVEDPSSLKFREGDGLFGLVRVNTEKPVAFFSNLGKVYIIRALDVPATTGFGEPLGSLFTIVDGEHVVGLIAPEPAVTPVLQPSEHDPDSESESDSQTGESDSQQSLFNGLDKPAAPALSETEAETPPVPQPERGILITRDGKGFRFECEVLTEITKRIGRRMANLAKDDEVVTVKPVDGDLVAVASKGGKILLFDAEQAAILSGPGQGVRMIKLTPGDRVVSMEVVSRDHALRIVSKRGKEKTVKVEEIQQANRATQGKSQASGIKSMERTPMHTGELDE